MSLDIQLHSPLTLLKGVGQGIAQRLTKCQLHCIQDLLFHLPLRYEDNSQVSLIRHLKLDSHAVIEGTISRHEYHQRGKKHLIVYLQDSSGEFPMRFLHYFDHHTKQLAIGSQWRCVGDVKRWGKNICLIHPQYSSLTTAMQDVEPSLTPIYPSTEGISQSLLRSLTQQAVDMVRDRKLLTDYLRPYLDGPNLLTALLFLHKPPVDADQERLLAGNHPMQQRLALEELLAHHLSLVHNKQQTQQQASIAFAKSQKLIPALIGSLAFTLTASQQRVAQIIEDDLSKAHPMQRLLQGDVGCGKTLIAALAALQVIEQGSQVALMVPTELLAEQHYQQFQIWFKPLQCRVALLSQRTSNRTDCLEKLASGKIDLVIGTHALFQEAVSFSQLDLMIIDEQHRFGVHQRLALREKGRVGDCVPHQLIMTATPIPRTLAMSAYADLDHAIIDELPPGRKPIQTVVLDQQQRASVIERMQAICEKKQQIYWLCTLIRESETLHAETAEATFSQLQELLPNRRIGLVHGQQKADYRESVMTSFQQGELDVLVATTVIEVGVNVPNASLMIIDNAERLGLAQLHQLRGRVGRGAEQSYCVLLYQKPLSQHANQRLAVMRESNDGFVIAERDLAIRGPGELLGTKQSGLIRLRIADLLRDNQLLDSVQNLAQQLQQQSPEVITHLIDRWLHHQQDFLHV